MGWVTGDLPVRQWSMDGAGHGACGGFGAATGLESGVCKDH